MKFKIIQNQHTPIVPCYEVSGEIDDSHEMKVKVLEYIKDKRELLEKFISFARTRKNCCGLAANQLKINGERLLEPFFVIKKYERLPFWNIYIFPQLVAIDPVEDKEDKLEGCLTWPNKTITAKRYKQIVVEYYDLNGNFHNETLDGFEAQIFQHEYDHLRGIEEIFVDMGKAQQ